MLSKPWAAVSAGKLSAGRMSMPSRSRIVLLYSARLSRRAVTCPASGLTMRSCRANSDCSQSVTALVAATGGCGVPGGGIFLVWSFSTTFSQISRSSSNVLAVCNVFRSTSPDLSLALWHATQLFSTNANTSGASAASGKQEATPATKMERLRIMDYLEDSQKRQKVTFQLVGLVGQFFKLRTPISSGPAGHKAGLVQPG